MQKIEIKLKKRIILSLIICAIVGGTSFIFHHTQRFYMYGQYAQSAFHMKRYDVAQDYLLKALGITPHSYKILQLLLDNGRFMAPPSGAEKAFNVLQSKGERDSKILITVADYFLEFKRPDLAEKVYVYWSRFDSSLSLQRKLAKVLVWQKKYPEAVQVLEKLRTQGYLSKQDLLEYADMLRFAGHNEKAREIYQQLITEK